MFSFKQALSAAATGALHSGTIDQSGHALISSIAASPSVNRAKAIEYFALHALSAPAGAIDWQTVIKQLQVLIPAIIQFIQLFKKTPTPPVV